MSDIGGRMSDAMNQ